MITTILCTMWLAMAPAHAQDEQAPVEPDAPAGATADDASESDGEAEQASEASALYRMGLDLVGEGKYVEGCALLERVIERYPASDQAPKAEEQMALAAAAGGGEACGGAPVDGGAAGEGGADQGDDGGFLGEVDGRLELTISQALVGPALMGVLVPGSLCVDGCNGAVYLAGGLVGLGAGIGLPLAITSRHPITQGQAMLVYSGESIGFWNGFFLSAAVPGVWDRGSDVFRVLTAGTVLGGVAGVGSAIALRPGAGQVAMFRSGFTWGLYYSGISFLLLPAASGREPFIRLGIGGDAGALVGALLATQIPISRARMNVINLSGYAGALGLGLLYGIGVVAADASTPEVWFSVLAAGATAGLATGAVLTRNMGDNDGTAWLAQGALLGSEGDGLTLGAPMPAPRLSSEGRLGMQLQLALGRF